MNIEYTPRGLLSIFFRHSTIFLSVVLGFVMFGVMFACLAPSIYEAKGSLLVKFGSQASPDIIRSETTPSIISQNDRREMMQSNIDILQSNNLLTDVLNEVGYASLYPGVAGNSTNKETQKETAIRKLLQSDLVIKSNTQSNVIDVSLSNQNPEAAAKFLSTLFEKFITRQSDIYNKPQIGFLDEQVKRSAAKLEESQLELKKFKAEMGISSIEDELNRLLEQKGDTNKISLDPNDDAWNKLADLREKEAQLLATYRPDSPQVQRARQSVAEAEALLNERKSDLAERTGNVSGKIDRRIRQLESQRKQYNDLVRQVELDEKNYTTYLQRSEEALVNETLNEKSITPISIVDEPVAPMKPVRPRRLLIIVISLLSGLVFGLGTVLLCETFNTRFTTPGQMTAAIGVPLLASFGNPYGRDR